MHGGLNLGVQFWFNEVKTIGLYIKGGWLLRKEVF
jgi:hypothetical protein